METITAIAAILGLILAIFLIPLIQYFTHKITGTTYVIGSKYDSPATKRARVAREEQNIRVRERILREKLSQMDNKIVEEAINNVKNSIYANTIDNIYDEAIKIQNRKR